jgi:hypothetical protein
MAGYTRQSAAQIYNGADITAPPLNAEFNKLEDSFDGSTGHSHNGTTGQGPKINLATSVSGYLPPEHGGLGGKNNLTSTFNPTTSNDATEGYAVGSMWENVTSGRVFICVGNFSASAVWRELVQVNGTAQAIIPETTDTTDLGTPTNRFQDLWLSGGISAQGNVSVGGSLNSTSLTTTGNIVVGTTIDINGGTVDGTVIGGSSAQAITGTLVTATTNFVGDLSGNVTGNLTGNSAGTHTGDVIGDVTGNVTAASGTSSFDSITVNGTLNMNAGTSATIENLSAPVNANDAARKIDVDNAVAGLVDSAPDSLNTLNELAAALADDDDAFNTLNTAIGTKLPKAGGTMSGAIAMGANKVTGLGDPTANQDAATKVYTDTQRDTRLPLAGGTMTGAVSMGGNKITATYTPSANTDLTTKIYVDGILGSATAASVSAAAAATSESNSATSASSASSSASAALASQNAAAASYDSFDDRYLGAKSSAPTVDNDGNSLLTGALYWNSTSDNLFVWAGSSWNSAAFDVGTALFDADIGSTVQAYSANLAGINQGLATTDSPTFVTVNATSADIGGWTITESGGSLYFATNGTNKMKLDASGNLDVVGSVNSSATIT